MKMAPFDGSHTTFYWPAIANIALSCRDLRSFEIRFKFESDVPIRFHSKVTVRFENFESARHFHCNSQQPRPLDGFWRKIRQNTWFRARMCLSGSRTYNLILDHHFPELALFWGPFLTKQKIFAWKSLNNGDAPLRTPLNRHRRRIKVA